MRKTTLRTLVVCILLASISTGCLGRPQEPNPASGEPASKTVAPSPKPGNPSGGGETEIPSSEQALAMLPQTREDLEALGKLNQYNIELTIDYQNLSFQGTARIDYVNQEQTDLERIYFRLLPNGGKSYGNGSLIFDNLLLDGGNVTAALTESGTVLEVPMPEKLKRGQSASFEIEFHGQVPRDFGGGDNPSGYGIYNYSDGVMALTSWYPILAVYDQDGWNLDPVSLIGDSVYSDTALYTVDVSLDPSLVVVATGVETERAEEGHYTRHHLVSGPVRDFTLLISPDFKEVSSSIDGTLVRSSYLPGDEEGGQAALEVTSNSLQLFNSLFGQYPFTELDVVDAPMRNALGVEYPGIFLIESELYEDPSTDSFIIATAHETAHQWWYSVVGNDVFEDPWLDEALTTYSSGLYYEDILGEAYYEGLISYWQDRYDEIVQAGEDDLIVQNLAYFEALNNVTVYSRVVYTKGALFFKALRERMGDKAFFAGLQRYYQEQKYQIASPEDLLGAFDESTNRSLDQIYQEWLYSAQQP